MIRRRPFRDDKIDYRTVDDLVGRIGKLDENLMWSWKKPGNNQRFTARINPVPWRIINGNMQMSNTGRDVQSSHAEDRHDP